MCFYNANVEASITANNTLFKVFFRITIFIYKKKKKKKKKNHSARNKAKISFYITKVAFYKMVLINTNKKNIFAIQYKTYNKTDPLKNRSIEVGKNFFSF
jgi:hypothetical protein